ncbi:Fe-S cluster assembly protein SufD [bacterium]|nr:Fe-S cluster assembly protein SufD [bacterium]
MKLIDRISDFPKYRKNESWKYSDISFLKEKEFQIVQEDHHHFINSDFKKKEFIGDAVVVFIDGVLSIKDSKFHENFTILPLNQAFLRYPERIESSFQIPESDSTFVDNLNRVFSESGVYIESKTSNRSLIQLIFYGENKKIDTPILSSPRVIFFGLENSNCSLLETHISYREDFLSTPVSDIILEKNSTLNYYRVKHEKNGTHLGVTKILQKENSIFNAFLFQGDSPFSRHELSVFLNERYAKTNISAIYASKGNNHVDNQVSVYHQSPNTESEQFFKGLLKDSSTAIFNGKVSVLRDAQQSFSKQLNQNLMLSNRATIYTKPQLEIDADDVKCSHGATSGQINKEELFYLQTRGVSKDVATKMVSKAFADEALNKIEQPLIKNYIEVILNSYFWEV